ncbi:carotenoid ester lipase [Coprinopsis cinerea AmutBmut pab1-1]|nr:carotenoid ester lipase [Coprinopsis cinerea AmutBmut pab1-1]
MFLSLLVPLFLSLSLLPVEAAPFRRIGLARVDPKTILCQISFVDRWLCPEGGLNQYSRVTPIGTASGVMDPDGAIRYSLKYANAARWQPSTLVNTWTLPNGSNNVTELPLACPQDGVNPSVYTEDCLSMVLYVPPNLTPVISNAPVLVWIHGGSFVIGSASEAGLAGSKLALETNSIVAVIQYRLGALGFLAPNGQTNLGVKDVVNALQFLKNNVAAFGGSPNKVTLAGQSSGANMIRALLGVPSASNLFRSAILQSDPMNFGLLRPTNQQNLLNNFTGAIGCNSASCMNTVSLSSILSAQDAIQWNPLSIDATVGEGQPIRPLFDGSFITSPVEPGASFPSSVNKPLMITTVLHEGANAIYSIFPDPVPEMYFWGATDRTFGAERTDIILSSPYYVPSPAFIVDGALDGRGQLQLLATDYLYKCPGWTFGKAWAQSGGQVYVGEYVNGASYPANANIPICTQPGVVCHQDDIQIVFGTVPSPTPAQAALTSEIQQRYRAFLNNGNPNVAGLANWEPATSTDARAIKLGGSGAVPVGACDPSFWGSAVQYDYQYYNQ